MKQIYLKFSMLLLCLVVGLSSAWGKTVTLKTADYTWTVANQTTSQTVDGVVFTFSKGSANPQYYTDGLRTYEGCQITISASSTISQIDFTYTTSNSGCLKDPTVGSITGNKWSGSSSSVGLTVGHSSGTKNGQVRITQIEVTIADQSYPLTIATNTNGSFTATVDGNAVTSGSNVAAGKTVTITATPNDGYEFNAWKVYRNRIGEYDTGVTISENNTFTMPSEAVTIDAYFYESTTPSITVAAPVFDVTTGTYTEAKLVLVSNYDDNLMYFYTVDGTTPSCDESLDATGTSKLYDNDEGVEISNTTTLNMIAVDEDGNKSSVTSATYTIQAPITITWSVNGKTSTTTVGEGETITFPTNPDDVYGKKFVGWVSSEIEGTTDTKPTFVTSAKASDDVTYYAVFANAVEGSSETATLSCTATAAKNKYEKTTATDDKGNTWNLYTIINKQDINNVDHYYFGLNSNNSGYNIASPTFPGSIISIKANVWNTSSSKTRYAYLCSSNETAQPAEGDLGEMTIATSTKNKQVAFEFVEDAEFYQFYIYASKAGAIGFESIEVTYGTPTSYSAYCTTVPECVAVTISEKCYDEKDGVKTYYSTFSTNRYLTVTDDVTISEVGLEDGKLKVANYKSGDIILSERGLLISSSSPGTKYIPVYNRGGGYPTTADPLGDNNLLKGTGDTDCSKEDMQELYDDYKYYRLTMHNGTQIGFWWGAENGGPFALGANKAYLVVPKSMIPASSSNVKVQSFWFTNDDATSISAPAIENNANDAIYNLNGQRVNTVTKGMYIKNGKKYLVK